MLPIWPLAVCSAKLQPRLQQFFLRLQKAVGTLVSDKLFVGNLAPFRESFAPVRKGFALAKANPLRPFAPDAR